MCVIFIAQQARPTERELAAMWDKNSHGAGIAWRETREDGQKIIKFEKGLDFEEMKELSLNVPFPFIGHFRIASIGGISRYLTHPFEVSQNTRPNLQGSTEEGVLFHNGHWPNWVEWVKDTLKFGKGEIKLPTGKWSDSRAMAWLSAIYGAGLMELIDENITILYPDKIEVFGKRWSVYDKRYMISNDFWVPKSWSWEKKDEPKSQEQSQLPAPILIPPVQQPGGAAGSGHTPFRQGTSETPQASGPPLNFPKDIGNAYRRQEISFDVVHAAFELKMLSKKQYNKLVKTRDRREWKEKERLGRDQKVHVPSQTLH